MERVRGSRFRAARGRREDFAEADRQLRKSPAGYRCLPAGVATTSNPAYIDSTTKRICLVRIRTRTSERLLSPRTARTRNRSRSFDGRVICVSCAGKAPALASSAKGKRVFEERLLRRLYGRAVVPVGAKQSRPPPKGRRRLFVIHVRCLSVGKEKVFTKTAPRLLTRIRGSEILNLSSVRRASGAASFRGPFLLCFSVSCFATDLLLLECSVERFKIGRNELAELARASRFQ